MKEWKDISLLVDLLSLFLCLLQSSHHPLLLPSNLGILVIEGRVEVSIKSEEGRREGGKEGGREGGREENIDICTNTCIYAHTHAHAQT